MCENDMDFKYIYMYEKARNKQMYKRYLESGGGGGGGCHLHIIVVPMFVKASQNWTLNGAIFSTKFYS